MQIDALHQGFEWIGTPCAATGAFAGSTPFEAGAFQAGLAAIRIKICFDPIEGAIASLNHRLQGLKKFALPRRQE